MKQSTREWIRKAESDYLLALSLTQRRKVPVRDLVPAARRLNDYAVKVRYPGTDATPAEMKAAARAAKSIRAEVRLALSL